MIMAFSQCNLMSISSTTCVSERFCFDPPEPAYNGGRSTWNPRFKGSKTPFGTQVEYSCGLGRRLHHYTENDTIIYDSKTLTCSWDRTWSPSEPVCTAGHEMT